MVKDVCADATEEDATTQTPIAGNAKNLVSQRRSSKPRRVSREKGRFSREKTTPMDNRKNPVFNLLLQIFFSPQ
jgi:hypothetical protein